LTTKVVVPTAEKMSMFFFRVVTPCELVSRHQRFGGTYFSPEDGGSMFLRNIGVYLQVHTALQPRRPTENFSLTLLKIFIFVNSQLHHVVDDISQLLNMPT
jgi:hypothetical protein